MDLTLLPNANKQRRYGDNYHIQNSHVLPSLIKNSITGKGLVYYLVESGNLKKFLYVDD